MTKKLEIVREPNGIHPRWLLIFSRNRDGTPRNLEDITDVMEVSFAEALRQAREEFYQTVEVRDRMIHDLNEELQLQRQQSEALAAQHAESLQQAEREKTSALVWQEQEIEGRHLKELQRLRDRATRIVESRDRDLVIQVEQKNLLHRRLQSLRAGYALDADSLGMSMHREYIVLGLNHGCHVPASRPWWHRMWRRSCCDSLMLPWNEQPQTIQDRFRRMAGVVRASMLAAVADHEADPAPPTSEPETE